MATLNAMLKANGIIGNLNSNLKATGASAGKASSGIGKIIKAFINLENIKKAMNISDEFINASASLNLINDGLQTQTELQDKIFASAQRSKSAYFDMADAVSDMGLIAGDTFGSNDELIAFTELAQKSFKIDGASSSELPSYMNQLAEAMADGKIQGNEFESIMNKAPEIADTISNYTGKSKTELTQETIGTDVMKNAMFAASDDINAKFEAKPTTFADVLNNINTSALQALIPVIEKINSFINSVGFQQFINSLMGSLNILAQVASWVTDIIVNIASLFCDNWSWISPIIWGVVGAMTVFTVATKGLFLAQKIGSVISGVFNAAQTFLSIGFGVLKGSTAAASGAVFKFNSSLMASPITWIIMLVIGLIAVFYAVIAAINHFAGTSISATGIIMGVFATVGAFIANLFMGLLQTVFGIVEYLYNLFAAFANFFGNVFNDPIGAAINLFSDLADNVLGVLEKIASGMDFVFGTHMADTVKGWRADLKVMTENTVKKYGNGKYEDKVSELDIDSILDDFGISMDRINYSDAWDTGYSTGEGIEDKIGSSISSFSDLLTGNGYDPTDYDPTKVEGTGSNGEIDVNMADEDLDQIRAIAERDYVANVATNSLAPNINIQFGEVHETADADKIAGRVKTILQQQIAMASEGVY